MSLAFLIFLVVWLGGLVCTFFPALPATLIIFLGALIASLLDGFQIGSDLVFLVTFAVITILIMSVDNLASAWGTKTYGGSNAAIWGALLGGLVGLLPVIPFGLIVGPFAGALLAELLVSKKPFMEAVRAAWGTLIGLLAGMAAKFVLHFAVGIWGLWRFWDASKSIFGG